MVKIDYTPTQDEDIENSKRNAFEMNCNQQTYNDQSAQQTKEFILLQETENVQEEHVQSKEKNTYSQGYPFIFRLLWFHFWKMAKNLKKVEKEGRKIEIEDIPVLEEKVKVEYSVKKMKEWMSKLDLNKATSNDFLVVIVKTFWRNILIIDLYAFVEVLAKLFSPYCISKIITLVKDEQKNDAYLWVLYLVIGYFFSITFGQQSWTTTQRTSVQVRLGLINLLYDKVSSLSTYSIKQANIGKIINMVSSDFGAIEWSIAYLFQCMLTPILFIIASFMLISRLEWAGVIAIILLVFMIPLQQKIAKVAAVYSKKQTQKRDKKVKVFAEMIEGIRIIKMYGWERAFNDSINKLRELEVKNILFTYIFQNIEQTVSLNGPIFIALFCLILCQFLFQVEVNTALIFYTIELVNLMSNIIMKYIGQLMNFLQDFKILYTRLASVLNIENVQMKSLDAQQDMSFLKEKVSPQTILYMEKFSAYWHSEDLETKKPVLRDINIEIKRGETLSIIGQIGSGKTSFLYSIMKEIPRYKGKYYSTDKISYVEQEPYIFQGTVRDNILFGRLFNYEFYLEVIKACCLADDLKILISGDQTLIGEKGANLSGGQRARLCLARAVYADNDLYLLDDPLSAVDSKVAKLIYHNIINGMLKDKAVILVTHQLNYALRCQKIAVFDHGTIILQGNPNEINFTDTVLAKYINEHQSDEEEGESKQLSSSISSESKKENAKTLCQSSSIDENNPNLFECESVSTNIGDSITNTNSSLSQIQTNQSEAELMETKLLRQSISMKNQSTLLSSCEKKEEEYPITLQSYKSFLKASPNRYFLIVVLLAFCTQEILFTIFYKFLAIFETGISPENFYIMAFFIYSGFFLFRFLQSALCSYFFLKVNQNITAKMIASLSLAKPILYDEIPSGTIINKFTTDINILDKQMPSEVTMSLEGVLHFTVISLTIIFTNHYIIIPIALELFIFSRIFINMKSLLLRTKQLDLENKAPIFQFFSSSLSGVLVINIYKQKEQFSKRMATLMNNSIRTYDVFFFVSRLFSILLQYVCLITSGIGITIVLTFSDTNFGQFGQTVTFFVLFLNFFHLTLRAIINLDAFMISSERAFSIVNLESEKIDFSSELNTNQSKDQKQLKSNAFSKIPTSSTTISDDIKDQGENHFSIEFQEYPNVESQQTESEQWPQQGQLKFEKVFMKYKEEYGHVLKGVSFFVKPRERVAIVGRTGAGKSSIIQSLFRMSEIDTNSSEGLSRILYDEKDIKQIPLQKLRRSIGIIPQSPFVFSGSIYHNIDPLEEYKEKDILQVLKDTGLEDVINKLPNGIHTDMSDSSSVFSMGQKQLVCLARVMLRNNKLIVLDEATANVDMETDQKIQLLLKEMFTETTIITIAHRLNTIADYDKVIVLDKGKVIEADSPFNLLALNENDTQITNNSTLFSQMVLHTGTKNAEKIFNLCRDTHLIQKKNN